MASVFLCTLPYTSIPALWQPLGEVYKAEDVSVLKKSITYLGNRANTLEPRVNKTKCIQSRAKVHGTQTTRAMGKYMGTLS